MASAQDQIIAVYGHPGNDYLHKYCSLWNIQADFSWFPVHSFTVNNDFKDKLFDFFWNLYYAGLHTEIKTFGGCFNDRKVRGRDTESLHGWAMAIDLNEKEPKNQMVIKNLEDITPEDRRGAWSPEFVQCVLDSGLYFGGNFIHRPDPMHIAFYNG